MSRSLSLRSAETQQPATAGHGLHFRSLRTNSDIAFGGAKHTAVVSRKQFYIKLAETLGKQNGNLIKRYAPAKEVYKIPSGSTFCC